MEFRVMRRYIKISLRISFEASLSESKKIYLNITVYSGVSVNVSIDMSLSVSPSETVSMILSTESKWYMIMTTVFLNVP